MEQFIFVYFAFGIAFTTSYQAKATIGNENNFRLLPSGQFSFLPPSRCSWLRRVALPGSQAEPQPHYTAASFFQIGRCTG